MLINKANRAAATRSLIVVLALIFLYLPIATLIIYSFNESRMVTVWTEFSLKWYRSLFSNADIIRAVGVSLTVALMTAAAAVVIGTLAAFVLTRVGRFRGESLFVLLMTAPMVLPDVITGLALLLIFVTLGSQFEIFADRGIWAIWIAHVTFCSAYATVVIRSRFRELDISIEEAAMDLGAGPVKVFFAIILPALMPSEVAAFLLAFTMSMDDLVIASFIAGPDSTTLPMLIFSSVRRGLSPEINALATIIVFIVSIFTFFAWLSMVKKQKRMRSDAAKAKSAAKEEQKLHYHAPHGDEMLDSDLKLNPEALAILKEQAAALAEGKDIAKETRAKLSMLRTQNEGKNPNAHAALNMNEANDSEAADSSNEANEVSEQTQAQDTAVENTAVMPVNLSGSAKEVTAASRQNSSSMAHAGKARVLDNQNNAIHTPSDEGEQDLGANAPTATKDKIKANFQNTATTSSSLAHAKAKKAAAASKSQANVTSTTANSLAVAKAKKAKQGAAKSQDELSAVEVTKHEQNSSKDSAKVVDKTES